MRRAQRWQLLPHQHQVGLGDRPVLFLTMPALLLPEGAGCKSVVPEKSELLEPVEKSSPGTSLTTDGGLWLFSLRTGEPVGDMSERSSRLLFWCSQGFGPCLSLQLVSSQSFPCWSFYPLHPTDGCFCGLSRERWLFVYALS